MPQPIVASYCTTFLKQEMLHIYRQVTGLSRVRTFVITKQRQNADLYPFRELEVLPRPRIHFLARFYRKYVRRMEPVFYRGEYDQLAGLMERRHADLLHVYFGHTGVHLLPFIRNWPKPTVVSFHGMDIMQRDRDEHYNSRLRELLSTLPLVLARSESLAGRLEELGCPPSRIRINRTGIPMDRFPYSERTPPADGSWHFVQAARLIPKKGLPDTLAAFRTVRARLPNARLTIAGEGPLLEKLRQLSGGMGLDGAVSFPGFLRGDDLKHLFDSAHLFVHPSVQTPLGDQEGVPNSMLEAMATGLPVAATRHGGIPEAVTSGVDGILVAEHSPDELAQAMLRLSDRNSYPDYSRRAAAHVRERFEQSRSIARLEEFYFELTDLFH